MLQCWAAQLAVPAVRSNNRWIMNSELFLYPGGEGIVRSVPDGSLHSLSTSYLMFPRASGNAQDAERVFEIAPVCQKQVDDG